MTDDFANPIFPRQRPCGHDLHPAVITNYALLYGRQCSCCRMNAAMYDVRRSQELILSNGGVERWRENCRNSGTSTAMWESTVRGGGGGKHSGRKAIIDIHGNDSSFRSAKKRLHNLAIELEEISVQEKAWELEQSIETGSLSDLLKMKRMQYSATNAIALYTGAVNQGIFTQLEDDGERFMRKRGREWEISARPDYPESDTEDEETRHKFFKTNHVQRDFIDGDWSSAGGMEDEGDEASPSPSQPKRKRRRMDAGVVFNPDTYIRFDADVDSLRFQATGIVEVDGGDEQSCPYAPTSILRTTPLKIDPCPHRHYRKRALKKHDGALRPSRRWDRRLNAKGYRPGLWTVGAESEIVDTSGYSFGRNYDAWQWYCTELQRQAEEEDMLLDGAIDSAEDGNAKEVEEEMDAKEGEIEDMLGMEAVLACVAVKGLAGALMAFPGARMWIRKGLRQHVD